jgi:hypothetical protein
VNMNPTCIPMYTMNQTFCRRHSYTAICEFLDLQREGKEGEGKESGGNERQAKERIGKRTRKEYSSFPRCSAVNSPLSGDRLHYTSLTINHQDNGDDSDTHRSTSPCAQSAFYTEPVSF